MSWQQSRVWMMLSLISLTRCTKSSTRDNRPLHSFLIPVTSAATQLPAMLLIFSITSLSLRCCSCTQVSSPSHHYDKIIHAHRTKDKFLGNYPQHQDIHSMFSHYIRVNQVVYFSTTDICLSFQATTATLSLHSAPRNAHTGLVHSASPTVSGTCTVCSTNKAYSPGLVSLVYISTVCAPPCHPPASE